MTLYFIHSHPPHNLLVQSSHLSALDELLLSSEHVLGLAGPCAEHGGLEGTSVAEGEGPWPLQVNGVDGVQVHWRLFLRLTTRQECDAWERWGMEMLKTGKTRLWSGLFITYSNCNTRSVRQRWPYYYISLVMCKSYKHNLYVFT